VPCSRETKYAIKNSKKLDLLPCKLQHAKIEWLMLQTDGIEPKAS